MANRNLVLENCRIIFRNFSGKEYRYNKQGDRNFCVLLSDDRAHELQDEGWNVKWLRPRNEGEDPQGYLPVAVAFDHFPPRIYQICGRRKEELSEDTIGALDWADIANVDLVINPYSYNVNGRDGIKAYVKTMYVQLDEDAFADKYNFDDSFEDDDTPF